MNVQDKRAIATAVWLAALMALLFLLNPAAGQSINDPCEPHCQALR